MNFIRNKFLSLFVFVQVGLLCLFGNEALAANKTLSQAGDQLTKDMTSFSKAVLWGAMVVGLGLLATGAVKLTKREGEGGIGPALKFLIAGIICVGIPAFVAITGGSLFDADDIGSGGVGGVGSTQRD